MSKKRIHGQYYTRENPFGLNGFKEWWNLIDNPNADVLEPFAGSNNIINMLQDQGFIGSNFKSFDIDPQNTIVKKQDTLKRFPKGFSIVVTNPPYLANNVAARRKLKTTPSKYDDLYKDCLEKCLINSDWVAAIIPESFINSGLFKERLYGLIELTSDGMFNDTDHPTCLAMFVPKDKAGIYKTKVWAWDNYLGLLDDFISYHESLSSESEIEVSFNQKQGQIGLIAIDNTQQASIEFCLPESIPDKDVSSTSRTRTRILLNMNKIDSEKLIKELNCALVDYRSNTKDILLTPFKGLRKDGAFRRRIDYKTAKKLVYSVLNKNNF